MEKVYVITLKDGTEVPVTKEVYAAYYRPEWCERYHVKVVRFRSRSFEKLLEGFFPVEKHLTAAPVSVEQLAEDAVMREVVLAALSLLSGDERKLIEQIYLQGVSEREYAKEIGVSRKTVAYRRIKILAKLKKIIE